MYVICICQLHITLKIQEFLRMKVSTKYMKKEFNVTNCQRNISGNHNDILKITEDSML
jgi:hypothetical protein